VKDSREILAQFLKYKRPSFALATRQSLFRLRADALDLLLLSHLQRMTLGSEMSDVGLLRVIAYFSNHGNNDNECHDPSPNTPEEYQVHTISPEGCSRGGSVKTVLPYL
jgi:hypothetical protein